ncbi:MAG: glycosyl transferase family 2 [Bacteroidetes bacterium]|nr:glycosyl transferase family 2 [Bacteroidota bacterium]
MDLSVIIVNYNVRQFLENTITSVMRAMEGLEGEVFVVDNASDDGSVEMVKSKFPRICMIQNKENVGFARGCNLGLKRAQGEYLLLLNPDTIVQEDTFHVMLSFFRETPNAGLAGCKILNPDGSFQLPCRRGFPTPWVAFTKIFGLSAMFPKSRLFGRYNMTYLSPDETYEVDAVSGSFMMVSRRAYESVGELDEQFFMYGEDLDWCYRVSQDGFKVYYVHTTKIIHFKGESTRRSNLDEVRIFYSAMQLFVEKHFSASFVVELFLTIGISFRAAIAALAKAARALALALVDFLLVDVALLAAGYIYRGHVLDFPSYAYPTVYTVPAAIIVFAMYVAGVYTTGKTSPGRAFMPVLVGYIFISAVVFFAKDFAFSRAVVIISGCISLVLLPGWRLGVKLVAKRGGGRGSLFGVRTLIVGTGGSAQEVVRKLRARVDGSYDVLGLIATTRRQIGDKIAGLEVIGSLDNVGKVISERKVGEVIFSMDGISYSDILSVIARSNDRNVNYRLVPNSLEAIIGKTRIEELDTIPLVEIEYNLRKPTNRFMKRAFDLVCSFILLATAFPVVWLRRLINPSTRLGIVGARVLLLPQVFSGRISLVGRPLSDPDDSLRWSGNPRHNGQSYLGPRGLTGLVQINLREGFEAEEIDRYKLYYAKNHSIGLDLEIIFKSLLTLLKN